MDTKFASIGFYELITDEFERRKIETELLDKVFEASESFCNARPIWDYHKRQDMFAIASDAMTEAVLAWRGHKFDAADLDMLRGFVYHGAWYKMQNLAKKARRRRTAHAKLTVVVQHCGFIPATKRDKRKQAS